MSSRLTRFGETATRYGSEVRLLADLGTEATPLIDARFIALGQRALSASENPFFTLVEPQILATAGRPESVDHHRTLLHPNAASTQEVDGALGLVDAMLGAEAADLTEQFRSYATEHGIFERLKAGEKFLVVSNHLELPDQGFTMGLWQKAARAEGIDRLENHLTVVVGRLIGYYQLGDTNVVDGILRKAGSVLKTFPAGGTEAISEDEQVLGLFRRVCNHRTIEAFHELMTSNEGRIICMAPSGEQDKFVKDEGVVKMRTFGKGTTEMMVDASEHGATIIPIFVDYANNCNIARLLPPIEPHAITKPEHCHHIGGVIAREGTFARGQAHQQHPDVARFAYPVVYGN